MVDVNLDEYREDVERLIAYIPWLESKVGNDVSKTYEGDNLASSSMSFPVYDSKLMSFVNEASNTGLMDRNYVYAYSAYCIKTVEDEKNAIENATVKDGQVLVGILSKYVLKGMTQGAVWTRGVENGVILAVLKKMKKLLEIWDQPLA